MTEVKRPILLDANLNDLAMLHPDKEARRPYEQALADGGDHVRILHRPGFIDLDCGCGYDTPAKALSCLRLEDMAEFYV